MRLVSIQVGLPRRRGPPASTGWTTGYRKVCVGGAVRVRRENLEGDGQGNRRWHGGPDMAVLAYPEEHYPRWRDELDWDGLPYGGFGENLTIAGTAEEAACLGDVWRAGTTVLQISEPRKPCRSIARFWGRPGLLRLVERTGRNGFYLRVLEEGVVEAGQEVRLVDRPHPGWSVARAMAARRGAVRDPGEAEALLGIAALGNDWRAHLIRALRAR
ncbi:MAG: MOSC domain-containing protein [Myxococcales bacterium]